MIIVPFLPVHLESLELQGAQAHFKPIIETEGYGAGLFDGGPAWSAMEGGICIGAGGFYDFEDGRALCWALVSDRVKRDFIKIHNEVLKRMNESGFHRIEAIVDPDFRNAHRWAKALGFSHEGRMKGYFENGDADLYARVRS